MNETVLNQISGLLNQLRDAGDTSTLNEVSKRVSKTISFRTDAMIKADAEQWANSLPDKK